MKKKFIWNRVDLTDPTLVLIQLRNIIRIRADLIYITMSVNDYCNDYLGTTYILKQMSTYLMKRYVNSGQSQIRHRNGRNHFEVYIYS